jgi:hypothetical protein
MRDDNVFDAAQEILNLEARKFKLGISTPDQTVQSAPVIWPDTTTCRPASPARTSSKTSEQRQCPLATLASSPSQCHLVVHQDVPMG